MLTILTFVDRLLEGKHGNGTRDVYTLSRTFHHDKGVELIYVSSSCLSTTLQRFYVSNPPLGRILSFVTFVFLRFP